MWLNTCFRCTKQTNLLLDEWWPSHITHTPFFSQVMTCQPSSEGTAVTWMRRPCPTGWWLWISPRWRGGKGGHTLTQNGNPTHHFTLILSNTREDVSLLALTWEKHRSDFTKSLILITLYSIHYGKVLSKYVIDNKGNILFSFRCLQLSCVRAH